MTLWSINLNIYEVFQTLVICFGVILISFLMLKLMWLNSPHLHFPDLPEYFSQRPMGICTFFITLRYLQSDLDNEYYWIKHVGFDGEFKSLLLLAFLQESYSNPDFLPYRPPLRFCAQLSNQLRSFPKRRKQRVLYRGSKLGLPRPSCVHSELLLHPRLKRVQVPRLASLCHDASDGGERSR